VSGKEEPYDKIVVLEQSGVKRSVARGPAMSRFFYVIIWIVLACSAAATSANAQVAAKSQTQVPAKAQAADPTAPVRQALTLAEGGRCTEALPVLKRSTAGLADKQLRYFAAFAIVRCGMSVNDTAAVLTALALLQRDFPDDPEVLYTAARIFAQFSDRAAQELARRFPNSPQVGRMNAEALESKQMWKEAIEAYRNILAQYPKVPGIHYRIATILLDTSSTAEAAAEAKKELEVELQINPDNASAVFVLGEVARRAGSWDEAVRLFTRAAQLDAGFMEAYFSLGVSLNASGKYADAIAPLERYAKGVPDDPAGHYQLAIAYSRTGNKAAADRELQLQREALAKKKLACADPRTHQRRGELRNGGVDLNAPLL
jgi:predicted Zn-dependent protease